MAGEPTLTRGERGDWVTYAKQLLEYHGVEVDDRDDDLEDDDEYGRKAARAVRKFQRHNGLEATGQVDEDTWRMLNEPPDADRPPPGRGTDEDEDSADEDDDDYTRRRRDRDGDSDSDEDSDSDDDRGSGSGSGGGRGSGGGGDDDDDKQWSNDAPGGMLGSVLGGIADQMGISLDFSEEEEEAKASLDLAGTPWIDGNDALVWRVKNSGKADASYYAVWAQVVAVDNNDEQMFYMEYQTSTEVKAGKTVEEKLTVADCNQLAKDQWKQFDEMGTYRLEVSIQGEGSDDWSDTTGVQFGVNIKESERTNDENEENEENEEDYVEISGFRYP